MLYGGGASPSLRVPASSASPNGSNVTTTGRPPLWNPSSQRKVSRLYLYTTLSLQKIIEVVHAKSPAPVPGKDSANKKLNSLLDKEPRWLHPRSESDMVRRLNQLGASPTRTSPRPHAYSDPPPFVHFESDLKEQLDSDPMTLDQPNAYPDHANRSSFTQNHQEPTQSISRQFPTQSDQDDGGAPNSFSNFIRQSTCLSSSTDRTNGTLHRVLPGYSDPYIKAIGRLIKRYTVPKGSPGMSPISEFAANGTWQNDDDAPPCLSNKPYHLPGDYLNLDTLMMQQPRCLEHDEQHLNRACLCFAEPGSHDSPWVTPDGVTLTGFQIIQMGSAGAHLGARDAFENTLLHFMAARAPMDVLLHSVRTHQCDPILNARNTAGQTFLHLLPRTSVMNHNKLCQLLEILSQKKFNIYAQDVYGRNFFHMMLLAEHSFPADFHVFFDQSKYQKRDAFDITPVSISEPIITISRANTLMDLDPPRAPSRFALFSETTRNSAIEEESRLIQFVNRAHQDPLLEDEEGRNALQCLAMATLSTSSVYKKYGMADPQMQANGKGKKPQEPKDLDSCVDRLKLRLDLAKSLLDAGVDPNHYDKSGYTPLMTFAALLPEDDDYRNGPMILEALIERHADVNARSRTGETALHIAVRCGRKLAARTLFNRGANVHVRDAGGRGLLDVADVKTHNASDSDPKDYVHYEACRAWLSGKGFAVQNPSVLQEWGSQSAA